MAIDDKKTLTAFVADRVHLAITSIATPETITEGILIAPARGGYNRR
jgi:hypothetical protein